MFILGETFHQTGTAFDKKRNRLVQKSFERYCPRTRIFSTVAVFLFPICSAMTAENTFSVRNEIGPWN